MRTMMSLVVHAVLAAALGLALVSGSQAQVSPELARKAPEAETISAIAQQQGFVRIIVQFAAPVPASEMRPEPQSLAPIKAQIAAVQDAIIAAHFGSATTPREGQGFPRAILRFDITAGFAVNVTKAELDSLAADAQVLHIQYDRPSPPVLIQSVPLIGMTNAYASGATGQGQAVAILDTGVQSNHEFLAGKVVMEACFSNSMGTGVSLCPNGQNSQTGSGAADPDTTQCLNGTTNLCFHGTLVGGIASGNNTNPGGGKPANGVAKSAVIVAVQVFTRYNDNTNCNNAPPCVVSWDSDQVSALNWLFQNALNPPGAKLASVNMSLGGGKNQTTCDSQAQKAPIDTLRTAGVATVISSGNDGYIDATGEPGCISTAVTVGSSDKSDVISSFSNMAPWVALMAPGGKGDPSDTCQLGANNPDILGPVASSPPSTSGYVCGHGTSFAAPHVAGAFAAIRTACPNATVSQILAALQSTGLSITDTRPGGTQTKPRIRVDLAVLQLGCGGGKSKVATHDFNGDKKSDILWRHTPSGGDVAMWLMNAQTILSSTDLGTVPTAWGTVGQRDFNGDGFCDILWRNATTGDLAMWLMSGSTILAASPITNVPISWGIQGTGDFNGDGKGDILWQDNSGNVAIWLMNGTTVLSAATLGTVPTSQWTIIGTGDFNGDGKYDIVWRDSSGNVAIWLMNGTIIQSLGVIGNASGWTLAGTGDINGDGRWDLVWHDGSGNVAIWFIAQGGLRIQTATLLANVSTNWNIVLTGDFNGDGTSDILWRNFSGDVAVWFMNGTVILFETVIGNVNTGWQVDGLYAD